jgi:hypothetical protein
MSMAIAVFATAASWYYRPPWKNNRIFSKKRSLNRRAAKRTGGILTGKDNLYTNFMQMILVKKKNFSPARHGGTFEPILLEYNDLYKQLIFRPAPKFSCSAGPSQMPVTDITARIRVIAGASFSARTAQMTRFCKQHALYRFAFRWFARTTVAMRMI